MLKDYNDYLNNVEDITFNLIQNIDVEVTEKKLRDYEAANKQAILDNMVRAREGAESIQARQAADIQSAQLRRLAAMREEGEARREQEEERKNLLQKLASGVGNAEELARESQETMRLKAQHRKQALDNDLSALENANGSAFTIKGLKKKIRQGPEKPYDPFGGMSDKRDYFTLQEDYGWDYFDKLKTDALFYAGGYDVREYYNRALCEAFSGLGVFIGDSTASAPPSIATAGAASASTSQLSPMSDDVF
jgi:CDK-activating kinase assembly factor MAT1